jgi:hypothetical protein
MVNPFTIKVIPPEGLFCNRESEQSALAAYARGKTNIVLYSPRRCGKTSLVRRIQEKLGQEDVLTGYADFFGLSSVDDVAGRIAKCVYGMLSKKKTLMQRAIQVIKTFRPVIRPTETGVDVSIEPAMRSLSGLDLLEKTMEDLSTFIADSEQSINLAFDEFQEITELKTPGVEGCLRKYIQEQNASYFFVGSRRRLLLDMFNQRKRPFYQSAVNFELGPLPKGEFQDFILQAFDKAGKKCSETLVAKLLDMTACHPYYSQKLALFLYNVSKEGVHDDDLQKSFSLMASTESAAFESMLLGLAPQQIALLRALAREPALKILTNPYMHRHGLKSVGGVQAATKKLSQLDLIEKDGSQTWRVVDPIFQCWLGGECASEFTPELLPPV